MNETDAIRSTLFDLLGCASSWQGDVRILGNVRAEDAAKALTGALEALETAEDYEHLAVLMRKREQPWIERWRHETGKHDCLPDYGEFLGWLVGKLDDLAHLTDSREAWRLTARSCDLVITRLLAQLDAAREHETHLQEEATLTYQRNDFQAKFQNECLLRERERALIGRLVHELTSHPPICQYARALLAEIAGREGTER